MADIWVRFLGVGTLFLGASFHRLFLYFLYFRNSKKTRNRELSWFLGLSSLAFFCFLFGIWGSFAVSYGWSMERVEELGLFLSIGVGFGVLFSAVTSIRGKGKVIGIALIGAVLLSPFLLLPRIFIGWIPVWESAELCSIEVIKSDHEGTGLILTYPTVGTVYVYLPDRNVALGIRQRTLSMGYRLFALPPLYCKLESLSSHTLKTISNETNLSMQVIQVLPQQKEQTVSLTLDGIKMFTMYSIWCNSRGELHIKGK